LIGFDRISFLPIFRDLSAKKMATAKKREEARMKAAEHTVLLQFTMGNQSGLRASYEALKGSYEALLADLPNVPEALTDPKKEEAEAESDDDKAAANTAAASDKAKAVALELLKMALMTLITVLCELTAN
jgi:hypothetical protein